MLRDTHENIFRRGAPNRSDEVAYDVSMENCAILLKDKTVIVLNIENDEIVHSLVDIDRLCSTGAGPCLIIYADNGPDRDVQAIAHISSCSNLNDVTFYIHHKMSFYLDIPSTQLQSRFFLYGSNPETFTEFTEDEPIHEPFEGCQVDEAPRIQNDVNGVDENYLDVFACQDNIIIHQYCKDTVLPKVHEQSYAFESQPTNAHKRKKQSQPSNEETEDLQSTNNYPLSINLFFPIANDTVTLNHLEFFSKPTNSTTHTTQTNSSDNDIHERPTKKKTL